MPEDVRKVVIRWYVKEVLNTGNLAAVDELFAPEYVAHVPLRAEPLRGCAAWKQRAVCYTAAFPDLRVSIEDVLADGDLVAARLTWRGTHRGAFMDVGATNRRVAVTGIAIWRIGGGKMLEEWIAEDLLGMMKQLGAIPAPGDDP